MSLLLFNNKIRIHIRKNISFYLNKICPKIKNPKYSDGRKIRVYALYNLQPQIEDYNSLN